MLEVALNELPEILRREIDALEAVSPEELRGLGMIQCLGHVGVNLRKKIRRHFWRLRWYVHSYEEIDRFWGSLPRASFMCLDFGG
jgi:hypothetical protein